MKNVTIIGGGAAGMACAVFAAENGNKVTLYEKNEKLGKKIYITGKGRCNFTNECIPNDFLENVVSNNKFLYSAIYGFDSYMAIDLFERLGMKTKVERGRRAFPLSDHASDVTKALSNRMKELGVKVVLNKTIDKLPLIDEDHIVVVATGGLSYPSTGSTGDGYRFAKETGHKFIATRPALVPLETKEGFITKMQGLSLKNVRLTIKNGEKEVFSDFGELLFTHFGISGPLAITASSYIGKILEGCELEATIDLKTALTSEKLEERILREFDINKNKQFKNVLGALLPSKMIPVMASRCDIPEDKNINLITKEERERLIEKIKDFDFTITALRGYNEAVVTQGGVCVKDINPKTMESKIVPNLYFIGEVLDVDALTGGYNLQIAWSSAYACAKAISEK